MKVTNRDISGEWFDYPEMTIPKGTPVTTESACGPLPDGQYFINRLDWVTAHDDGTKKHGFIHDATYRGIRVTEADVEEADHE